MKLLLTSGGITNDSIRARLIDLLGRPIEQSRALFIPTGQWGHPMCGPETVWKSTAGRWDGLTGLTELGWASVGVLELTALPSIPEERWMPWVRDADVLLVDGGEATFLAQWLRESGLAAMLSSLTDTVWVGVSAGSMVLTPRIGDQFVERAGHADDETLGIVDFSVFPHLDYPGWSSNTSAAAEAWASDIPHEAYALDDQSAIVVDGDVIEVVSEGSWRRFSPSGD
ncbi:Type 1 glutamine amidotransferase-like domain-containing protein [Microbacterium koreense]|uniref:Type 1 glutamine amidotransferase-like domain-containing protein n=1 Tax=Microbacterium koreense TaxID=323761 RepID=A0ABW2ZNB1_9MICO